MSSAQFERVLHPIFEEDELTLILAGAALGFAAGLVQQGIETGKIKIPGPKKMWTAVATTARRIKYLSPTKAMKGLVLFLRSKFFAVFRGKKDAGNNDN
eukprot:84255_1